MKHHVIYVPGITDDTLRIQSSLLQSWRLWGVVPHLHAMPWAGSGTFEPKLARLLARIDSLHDKGHIVSLVGASAGASAVVHAYILRKEKLSGLVYICGKINRPETVSDRTYTENPAFKKSLYSLQSHLAQFTADDKANMLSFYSKADTTVPYEDTIIPGVQERQLPAIRHGWAIVYAISLGSNAICRFLKWQAQAL